jgi:hypothetical protein
VSSANIYSGSRAESSPWRPRISVKVGKSVHAPAIGGVRFHEAQAVGAETVAEVQAKVRRRVSRALARRGLLEREEAEAMLAWDHGGGL